MSDFLADVKPTAVRSSFVEGLSRMCLVLALGHFLSIPGLYLMFASAAGSAVFYQLTTLVTLSGTVLLVIAFLCRYEKIRAWLPYVCLMVLYSQTVAVVLLSREFNHPVALLLPLLVSLGAPILGRNRSYLLAALSAALLLGYFFAVPLTHGATRMKMLPALLLVTLVVAVTAYLAETVWHEVLTREARLTKALEDIAGKTAEMERWVQQLGRASSLISAGHLTTELPEPLPYRVFAELTRGVEQMQDQLKQYFSDLLLKDTLSSVGVMATGVAHELNTPLTSLKFIIERDKGMSPDTRRTIEDQVNHMSEVVKGLLSFARPREDEMLDLNEVVRGAERLMRYMKQDGIRLQLVLTPGELPLRGVAKQLQQVLVNLYVNAVDALEGRASPAVWITTERREPDLVVLTFRDNGSGMSGTTLSRVVEPFFTTKPPDRGTGLGLFIVHQIARSHGARLEMESVEGQGTTVRLIFMSQAGMARAKAA